MGRGPDDLLGVGAARDGRPSATDCRQTAACPVVSSAWGAQEYSRSPGGRLWSTGVSSTEGAFLEMERWASQNSHRGTGSQVEEDLNWGLKAGSQGPGGSKVPLGSCVRGWAGTW